MDTSIDQQALTEEMKAWRRDFHANPEFGFEERRTSSIVAAKLREFGFDDVAEGIGKTGVVGTLKRGTSNRAIALRADMDALRITEKGDHPHRSQNEGVMHACGHDGHTAMLLGAAKMLASEGGFDGTVRFIFQPAEEWGKGALAMLDDGVMDRFPFQEVYGLHNAPGLQLGRLEAGFGPVMSAEDNFEICLSGVGGHASRPQSSREVLVAACATVMNLQTIVSRRLCPSDVAVVSVTELITDGTRNALPGEARVVGDARSFRPEVSTEIEREMRRIAEGVALSYGVNVEVSYTREFVPVFNDEVLTRELLTAAGDALGPENARQAKAPSTGSEDFARFLDHVPGSFAWIGNGESAPLHNPRYDFNDDGLLHGARVHASIVRRRLHV
ncbi:M20 aminoacylase family protein [Bosea lathyri]|uniref:Hippurate hydrolase n=1 Tax=Bosea lathyri TaxID=1036778 RepID=A0A1H6CCU2_9HYPH|nr:M20 aminoacylase family protein [Bosea lathyri]SEG70186.1 hippurate hydrolase [Bosea lathyri]